MNAFALTALITLLAVLLFFATAFHVGQARGKYGVKAPAVSGHELFERAFRVQMNTLEALVLMLPALWLCAVFRSDTLAASLGAAWLVGRIWYALAYLRDPARRGGGFTVSILAFGLLWGTALWGVVASLCGARGV